MAQVRILNKLRSIFRKEIKATPELMACTAAGLPSQLADQLEKKGLLSETERAGEVRKELFRAYFCLASLCTARHLQDDVALNRYGSAMLDYLHKFPEERSKLIRDAFADVALLDDAIRCYVHGELSQTDREAIEDHRLLLRLSEDNPVHFFAGMVHLWTMRILELGRNPEFLIAWFSTSSFIISAVSEVFNHVVPELEV